MTMQILIKDYQRYRYLKGITITEYLKEKPMCVLIDGGFNEHFGPGKSPFEVFGIIIIDRTAHVLVDKIPSKIRKWRPKLLELLESDSVVFYDINCGLHTEEWNNTLNRFEKIMEMPLWQLTM